MLKEAIEKILSIAETKTFEINGDTYSDKKLIRIEPNVNRPVGITVNSLDGIVKLVKTELQELTSPLFVRVASPRRVLVCTALDDVMERDYPYTAECDLSDFRAGYRDQQSAIIELRSQFIQSGEYDVGPNDVNYVIDLISNMTQENSVTSDDNGVTQKVEARQGIALKQTVKVKPRVTLIPFRTFREVEQPASEFLLRVRSEDGAIGLFEADGGMWQLEAKDNIAKYFEDELSANITRGEVVIIR